jgi:hypothetical protein
VAWGWRGRVLLLVVVVVFVRTPPAASDADMF